MNIMDMSQISELATAIIDWTSASSPEFNSQMESQATSSVVNKSVGDNVKQDAFPSSSSSYSGLATYSSFLPPNDLVSEQVPMDDYDPLETFSFWDDENCYHNQEYNSVVSAASNLQADCDMSELSNYLMEEDTLAQGNEFDIKDVDILHNPTLAELNACSENLLEYTGDTFISDDTNLVANADILSKSLPLQDQSVNFFGNAALNSNYFVHNVSCAPINIIETKSSSIHNSLSTSCPVSSNFIPCAQYLNPCDEKFLLCPQNSPADSFLMRHSEHIAGHVPDAMISPVSPESIFLDSKLPSVSLLSTSAPPDVTMASFATRVKSGRGLQDFSLKSIYSSERSLSGLSSLSLSNDDESGSYIEDSEHEDDYECSSDDEFLQYESDEMFSTSWPPVKDSQGNCSHRKHRYFWQYNLQSRGVKTRNLMQLPEIRDPHILNEASDPVFSEEVSSPVRHSGKARRGDGNDLTPNPCKLFNIGVELKKLNKLIYNMNPEHETEGSKPLSRKEKNKLASRVCRLKKKAQHEANKIKLYGLQQEHKRLLTILIEARQLVRFKVENPRESRSFSCAQKLENYLHIYEPYKVADKASDFVNEVLERVAKGELDGGLGRL